MYVLQDHAGALGRWIRDEVEFNGDLANGSRGNGPKRVQEWLNLHGIGLAIDGQFGNVTQQAVERFQESIGLVATGIVDEETHTRLVAPMLAVLQSPLKASIPLGEAFTAFATVHLNEHPREIGGANCGPWVRLYMNGNEGVAWPWCAGFVTFLMNQACESMNADTPITGSGSCDSLAAQGREAGLFVSEREVQQHPDLVRPGAFFLVRKTSTDWTHTGMVTQAGPFGFDTIEGNTNDNGDREGYEVCTRIRGYNAKDFIVFG